MGKVIVVGGSAGAVQALSNLLKGLPADLSAPVLAVIHIGEEQNLLAQVLQRSCALPVSSPSDAEPLVPGHVYIAAPNRHLMVREGCVMSTNGPRENRHRPAVDALFRSAARAFRSDVVGVILSGALDDGVAGCLAIQARGGTIVVQDPSDAQNPDMPSNVLRALEAEYLLPVSKIPPLLAHLARNGEAVIKEKKSAKDCSALSEDETMPIIEPFTYTCPECGGSVAKIENGNVEQFRCNVGHIFTSETFSSAASHALERALWTALQRLNEQRSIQEHLSKRASDETLKRRYSENAAAAAEDMKLLHGILLRL